MCTNTSTKIARVYAKYFFSVVLAFLLIASSFKYSESVEAAVDHSAGYGITKGLRYGLSRTTKSTNMPVVQLITDPMNEDADITYLGQDGLTSSTLVLRPYESDIPSAHHLLEFEPFDTPNPEEGNGTPKRMVFKATQSSTRDELLASDLGIEHVNPDEIEIYLTLSLSEDMRRVKHEYSIVNNSDKPLSLFPCKADEIVVDSQFVTFFSRGANQGAYAQPRYMENRDNYMVHYQTDVPNGPKAYSVLGPDPGQPTPPFSQALGSPFEETFSELAQWTIRQPAGTQLIDEDALDRMLYLTWGKVELKPGKTWTGRYDVNVAKQPDLTIQKQAHNLNGTATHKPGDMIQYDVTVSYDGESDLERTVILDRLPSGVAIPTNVKLKKQDGSVTELNVSDVYDPSDHSLTIPLDTVSPANTYELIYEVRIARNASGQTLTNTAMIKGVPSGETEISASAIHELQVETVPTPEGTAPDIVLTNANGEYDGEDYKLTGMWSDEESDWVDLYYQIDGNSPVQFGSQVPNNELPNRFEYTIKKGIMAPNVDHKIIVYAIDDTELKSNIASVTLTARKGELLLQSYPVDFSFGDNLKVPLKDTSYPVDYMNGELIVCDTRPVGQTWSMTARVIKRLQGDAGSLGDTLFFYKDGEEYQMKDGISVPVIQHETINDDPVNVSENWDSVDNGFRLKILGHTIKPGNYSGNIEWTLSDVPLNK